MASTLFTSWLVRKTGLRPGVANFVETTIVTVIVVVLNMGTGVIVARIMGPQGRGEVAAILIASTWLPRIFSLGIPAATVYRMRQSPATKEQTIAASILLSLLVGLLVTLGGIFVIPFWLDAQSPSVIQIAQMMMFFSPLTLLNVTYQYAFRGLDDFAMYNLIRLARPSLILIGLVTLILVGGVTVLNAAIAYKYFNIPVIIVFSILLAKKCRPEFANLAQNFKELSSYGLRGFGPDFTNNLVSVLDRLFLVAVLSPTAVGLYVVARSMADPINLIGQNVVAIVFPKASGYSPREAISASTLAARFCLVVTAACAGILAAIAPQFLGLVFGKAFLPAVPVFRILLAGVVLGVTASVLEQAFMATGRPGLVTNVRMFELIVLIPALIWVTPAFGTLGVAMTLLAVSAMRLILIIGCFPVVLKQPAPRLWLNRADVRRLRRPGNS